MFMELILFNLQSVQFLHADCFMKVIEVYKVGTAGVASERYPDLK